jgi:hypothetical protein
MELLSLLLKKHSFVIAPYEMANMFLAKIQIRLKRRVWYVIVVLAFRNKNKSMRRKQSTIPVLIHQFRPLSQTRKFVCFNEIILRRTNKEERCAGHVACMGEIKMHIKRLV